MKFVSFDSGEDGDLIGLGVDEISELFAVQGAFSF